MDLFSGIGGISLALKEWVTPLAYCETDAYCQAVLLSRMAEESLCNAPIWDDVKTLDGTIFKGEIDIIYGGFPCQDISVAGKGKGLEGERSGLFFEIVRLAKEIKPKFIFLENVPAITTRGGMRVIREITEMGYDCRWCVISAASVGALHRRERWFLLAYTEHNGASPNTNREIPRKEPASGKQYEQKESFRKVERTSGIFADVAEFCHSNSQSSQQTNTCAEPEQAERGSWRGSSGQYWPFESREHWQETVSEMDKCSDGIPYHVDRLRAMGNAVSPQQAKEAFKILMGIKG